MNDDRRRDDRAIAEFQNPLMRGLTCAALHPRLRSILVFDASPATLHVMARLLAQTIAVVTGGEIVSSPASGQGSGTQIVPVQLGTVETEEKLWGSLTLNGAGTSQSVVWKAGLLAAGRDRQTRIVVIPDITRLSLAARRACVMLVGAKVAHLERHGRHDCWQPQLYWLAGCDRDRVGMVSPHLLGSLGRSIASSGNIRQVGRLPTAMAQAEDPKQPTTSAYEGISGGEAISQVVILTALKEEHQAVEAHLKPFGQFKTPTCTWNVAIAQIDMGNVSAAMEAVRAIEHFKPRVILFVGVAGGIKDVDIGDVVAASEVYGYECGKLLDDRTLPRPKLGEADHDLKQRAQAEARKEDWRSRIRPGETSFEKRPNVYIKPIAAGEKVIASRQSAIYNYLREYYDDAVAVEMEGFGFLKATGQVKTVSAIVIRGISDLNVKVIFKKENIFVFGDILISSNCSINSISDRSFIAPLKHKMQSKVKHNLPQKSFSKFVNRQEHLEELMDGLSEEDRQPIITIAGIGGVGKTTLALEAAYRCLEAAESEITAEMDTPRFETIIFISAQRFSLSPIGIVQRSDATLNLEDICRTIATVLNDYGTLNAMAKEQPRLIKERLRNERRTLIIVDNLETLDDRRKVIKFLVKLPRNVKSVFLKNMET